jgi:hypothetical protein
MGTENRKNIETNTRSSGTSFAHKQVEGAAVEEADSCAAIVPQHILASPGNILPVHTWMDGAKTLTGFLEGNFFYVFFILVKTYSSQILN